jgi:hypothetical protein
MKLGLYEFFCKLALEKRKERKERKERKGKKGKERKERKERRRGSEPLSCPVRWGGLVAKTRQ